MTDTDFRALCAELVEKVEYTWSSGIPADAQELLERVSAALADEPAVPAPLADTHYEWELQDAEGEWQAGGSANSRIDVEREGMRYLQAYAQDGPHTLIIRHHTTQTIHRITNG